MEQHYHGTPGGQLKLVDQKFYGEREYEARKNYLAIHRHRL
jgi:hypothetical protein